MCTHAWWFNAWLHVYVFTAVSLAGMFVSGGRGGNIFVWDTRCSSKGILIDVGL